MRRKDAVVRSKRQALARMRKEYPSLFAQVRGADADLVLKLDSMLQATSKRDAGLKPLSKKDMESDSPFILRPQSRELAERFASGLKDGSLSTARVKLMAPIIKATADADREYPHSRPFGELTRPFRLGGLKDSSFKVIAPHLVALAKRAHDVDHLSGLIMTGLHSKSITPKTLEKSAKILRRAMEPIGDHGSWALATALSGGLESCTITHKSLRKSIRPILRELYETEGTGHDPGELAMALGGGLASKVITHRSLEKSAKQVRHAIEAAQAAGHDRDFVFMAVLDGLESGVATPRSLPAYIKLRSVVPEGWDWEELAENALEARKAGLSATRVFRYQTELAKRGHFPNAGLIKMLHQAKLKEGTVRKK